MSILDDAIREHLELKRAHGANEAELKKLEDEAFGPPQRPDEMAAFEEAPTEFLGAEAPPLEEDGGRRTPNIADLQEAPEPPPFPEPPEAEPPAVEEHPAMEHEAVPPAPSAPEPETPAPEAEQPPIDSGPSTEEREAIAEQPTQFFDVQAELSDQAEAPPAEPPAPSDEELAEAEESEPRLGGLLRPGRRRRRAERPARPRAARGGGRGAGLRGRRGRRAPLAGGAASRERPRGRARGHAHLPRGGRGRRPLVRAAPAEGLRLRRLRAERSAPAPPLRPAVPAM
jgi:hypothetical protein